MARNFAEIAFTDAVKAQQEKHGSRRSYARMEAVQQGTDIGFAEAEFIAERDGFYLATVGANGYPYVQFRGGPSGFLKVLDHATLGYADFRGNLQYVSVGNLDGNNRAALILMDYANRRRLKIYARIEVVDAGENPELIARLEDPEYPGKIERAMVLHVEAFDWNCPQHITPRLAVADVEAGAAQLRERLAELEAEVAGLRRAARTR